MSIMYLSYDGMTDPLGQSQVIPYLEGIAKSGKHLIIISFEKKGRFKELHKEVQEQLDSVNIEWQPVMYTKWPPVLSTVYDLIQMYSKAKSLIGSRNVQILSARSLLPALVARRLKWKLNLPLLYDTRGFWADERVESGAWPMRHPLYRSMYKVLKKQEVKLYNDADHVVIQTSVGVDIIKNLQRDDHDAPPVSLISTCVNTRHFDPGKIDLVGQSRLREQIEVKENQIVVGYIGSIGTWYMLKEMLDCFSTILRSHDGIMLIVTRDDRELIFQTAKEVGLDMDYLRVESASYSQMPLWLSIMDIGLFFINPLPSKKGSSPVKMGEFLAMGNPVITNTGVGDVEKIINASKCGIAIKQLDQEGYSKVADQINGILKIDPSDCRATAMKYFSLEDGIKKYVDIYERLAELN